MSDNVTSDGDRILVGVDGSAASIEALRYAAYLADALGAPVHAVAAWGYPALADYYDVGVWSPEQDAATILQAALEAAFGDRPPENLSSGVIPGPPARALIDESRRASMLVVGSRGRGGFAGLLLGSVSQACAAHAHCPVLVMHPSTPQDSSED